MVKGILSSLGSGPDLTTGHIGRVQRMPSSVEWDTQIQNSVRGVWCVFHQGQDERRAPLCPDLSDWLCDQGCLGGVEQFRGLLYKLETAPSPLTFSCSM